MEKVQQTFGLLQSLGPWAVPIAFALIALVLGVIFYFLQGPIKYVAERAAIAMGWVGFVLKFLFPPALVAMAYGGFPALHQKASLNFPADTQTGIIVIGVIGTVWLVIFQTMGINNPRSTLGDVTKDFLISLGWMVLFFGWTMYAAGQGNLEYWLVLPTLFFVADVLVGTIVGFRNMFQKSPIQPDKGGV